MSAKLSGTFSAVISDNFTIGSLKKVLKARIFITFMGMAGADRLLC